MNTYTVKDVREYLKELSAVISTLKRLRKQKPDLTGIDPELVKKAEDMAEKNWGVNNASKNAKWNYRHHHIAACEFRGKSREQIERPAKGNEPNEKFIADIKEKIAEAMEAQRVEREKVVCLSA